MRKIYFSLLCLFVFSFTANVFAQISHGGEPRSFNPEIKGLIKQSISTVTMPLVEVEKLKAEDIINDKYKDRPWRFGQNIPVNLNPSNSGIWDILPDNSKLWRLRIYSEGALTINLIFDKYKLPQGAELFVYNQPRTHVIGSFTRANNQEDGVFATTLVNGDAITIEYYEPANPEFNGELNLINVTHGYRGAADFAEKGFGSSGSCNVNVACPQSAGWENEIRSACMLVSGGSGFCSGALVNNTNNDGTPYVLTADHCYSNPSSWVFWFNWQSATCTNPGSSPAYQSVSGAVLRARNSASDFCLVQINSTPPSNYNVYYSGWNRNTDNSIAGTIFCIHHPAADIKKISWSTLGITKTTYLQNPVPGDGTHWRITNWSDGTTTEGGSSGSPLYDPNHRIVGQLHGGYASCSSITSDWYGIFGVSWTGGGTASTMLQPWLDPAGANPPYIDGYDPNTPTASLDAAATSVLNVEQEYCGPVQITPAVIIKNYGSTPLTSLTVSYNVDGSGTVNQAWTGNLNTNQTDTVIFAPFTPTSGSHVLASFSSQPNSGTDENQLNDTTTYSFTVGNLVAPVPSDNYSCGPGSVSLTATSTGDLFWYDVPTGGTPLFTGYPFNTPVISATTTYYVETHIIEPAQYVGNTESNTNGSIYTATTSHYLIFTVSKPVKLVSAEVNAQSAGNRTIELRSSTGAVLQSSVINIPAGVSRITLNWDITPGINYRLAGPASPGLYRNNAGVSYPYEISGLVSITNSSAGANYYYFFYDWEVKEPDCISERVPVNAVIESVTVAGFTYSGLDLDYNFTNTSANATSYLWDFGDSTNSTDENPAHSFPAPGSYLVTLTADGFCGSVSYSDTVVVVAVGSIIHEYADMFSIYPNPSNGLINVYLNNTAGDLTFSVENIIGEIVYLRKINSGTFPVTPVNLAHLRKGVYFVKISEAGKESENKILIIK